MTSYLVSYDLSAPGRNYDELIAHLKHTLESTWVVVTDMTSNEVRDAATKYVDANDKLLVLKLSGAGSWRGLRASTTEWLKKHL
ncbi:SinR family protein [Rathayibacter sp. AY1E8]|uniref:SinR family protein n=1 Tax=unclassified Rathayibacter TaxID=2609250 RepID=UPI000CE86FB6|nr:MULTISPECIES: SinR family protein [unclassified Rathayibacter]PPF11412.1 SinR family protein [Rathayibacter sp. AY1A5]PPF71999.1 SinR family protein [Rathayibacter sp. AY1E6]PPG18994.1 SinR family protein [Rathayibacter sp. AY1E8]